MMRVAATTPPIAASATSGNGKPDPYAQKPLSEADAKISTIHTARWDAPQLTLAAFEDFSDCYRDTALLCCGIGDGVRRKRR